MATIGLSNSGGTAPISAAIVNTNPTALTLVGGSESFFGTIATGESAGFSATYRPTDTESVGSLSVTATSPNNTNTASATYNLSDPPIIPTPTPDLTPTPAPTATPTPAPTATPTPAPTPTPEPTATPTPAPTPTPEPTATPTPTPAPTAAPTATPTPAPTPYVGPLTIDQYRGGEWYYLNGASIEIRPNGQVWYHPTPASGLVVGWISPDAASRDYTGKVHTIYFSGNNSNDEPGWYPAGNYTR